MSTLPSLLRRPRELAAAAIRSDFTLRNLPYLALAACVFIAASPDVSRAGVTTPVRTIREATAAGPESNARAGIMATVNAFQIDIGGVNNGNAVGSQGTGRRQITWDGGDNDSAPARLPADFFNAIAPRGAIFGGDPRVQFQQTADSTNANGLIPEFGHLNATYPTAFASFSAPRLFSALNSNVIEVRFVIPGTLEPAAVAGFGAVFTDVDVAGSSRIRFFDTEGALIFERDVLATAGNESLSFLGVTFTSACLGRVQIVAGNGVLPLDDVTQTPGNPDIVVLDDFIYGEPQPLTSRLAIGAGSKAPFADLFEGTSGNSVIQVDAFDDKVKRGVSVAAGDVNGDGVPDLITGAGPLALPIVHVFDGVDGSLIRDFLAFEEKFKGGVFVAAGNVNGDGAADIIVGAGAGPHVKVFSGATSQEIASFFAYDGKLRGGVRVAAGDVNGDFLDDIITAPGRGADAQVKVFDATTLNSTAPSVLADFIAAPGRKGVFVAAGDLNGDGRADYVVGSDAGSPPVVRVIDGVSLEPMENVFGLFQPFPASYRGGVRVAVADVNGNGRADILTSSGKGKPTLVRVFDPLGESSAPFLNFLPYGPTDKRGAFVGAISR